MIYLSGNWHKQSDALPLKTALEQQGALVYDWSHFSELSLGENAVEVVQAIRNCSVFAAVFDDAEHKYSGTLETLAMALSLGKKVLIYIGVPQNHGLRGGRLHRWNVPFDRFLLYHPDVQVYTSGHYNEFEKDLLNTSISRDS